MPNRTEIWLFQGGKSGWNWLKVLWKNPNPKADIFHWDSLPRASMQKPHVQVERLLGSVKQQKESDGVTIWQVNKTHWWHSGHLMPMILPYHHSVTWWHSIERRQLRSWSFWSSLDLVTLSTVLAVSKCVKHNETWNTVLKHVEVKFWCGTRHVNFTTNLTCKENSSTTLGTSQCGCPLSQLEQTRSGLPSLTTTECD